VTLPDGAHVDEENVVFTQYRVAVGALLEGLEGIGAEAHQQRVPDALHVEVGEDVFAQLARFGFEHAGADALGQLFDGLPGHGLGIAHGFDAVGGAHGFFGLCGHRYLLVRWLALCGLLYSDRCWAPKRNYQKCNPARPPSTKATPPAVYDRRFNHSLRVNNVIAANEIAI